MVNVVDVVPITTTEDRVLADREKAVFPVPLSVTVCGLPAALSVIVSVPVRAPLPTGLKAMLKLQLPPTFRMLGKLPQVFVWTKSPVMLMAVMVTELVPLLVRDTVWGGLVV